MTVCIWRLQAAIVVSLCLYLVPFAGAHPALARSKPGPVDERGVAAHVSSRVFTLRTASHGSFQVVVTADTTVTLKGKRSRLEEGDHVGVQGFQTGRTLRAIWVHIYSRAVTKPFSDRGTVTSVAAGRLTVQTGGGTLVVTVAPNTPVVVGSRRGHASEVRKGDRVLVRVQRNRAGVTALHIHVYRSAARLHHVSFTATVVAIVGTAVTVKTGSGQKQIQIPTSAVIYLGNIRTSRSALHTGEQVRVYACCAGQPLTATSVHIHRSKPHVVSEILHGLFVRLVPGGMVITVSGRQMEVLTPHGTVYEIASATAGRGNFRPGDEVTVRAHLLRGRIVAVRIDVPAASRTPRTIIGTVTAVSPSHITVTSRGRLYRLDLSGASVTLGGKRVSTGALRAGDKVHAKGILRGTTLTVSSLSAVRPPPVMTTIRGTVVSVHGKSLVIVDTAGTRRAVRLPDGVRPVAHGIPVSAAAVFPGVQATVKGTMNGSTLLASSLEVSVEVRALSGRLVRLAQATLQVKAAGRLETVDLGGAPVILDTGRHIPVGALKVGAFLEVKGYVPASYRLRATTIRVLHPDLDITGTLVTDTTGHSIRTSAGEIYRIHISGATQVTNARAPVSLTIAEVPDGTRLHVTGKAGSDGSISAATVVVQLSSVTLRGKITGISGSDIAVSSGAIQQTVRLDASAGIWQGSQPLQVTDLVVGDDVTVTGYAGKDVVLARKLQVHRALVGLDGTVQSTGSSGITLSSSTGTIRVVVGPDTQVSGNITIGATIHVTGYRRGDGVILATRIRAGK